METLVGLGADTFYEVGPGNVLTGLAKRTVDAAVTLRSVTVPTDERMWRRWDERSSAWATVGPGGDLIVARGLGDIRATVPL